MIITPKLTQVAHDNYSKTHPSSPSELLQNCELVRSDGQQSCGEFVLEWRSRERAFRAGEQCSLHQPCCRLYESLRSSSETWRVRECQRRLGPPQRRTKSVPKNLHETIVKEIWK